MKKFNKATVAALVTILGVSALTGCKKDEQTEKAKFAYSIGIKSGLKTLTVGDENQMLEIYDNGVDKNDREYVFESTNTDVCEVDPITGAITVKAPGKVSFFATETRSGRIAEIGGNIDVVEDVPNAFGGYNYSAQINPDAQEAANDIKHSYALTQKAEMLGKLEKYAMDSHLTGITLFDNGGQVKYSNRVKLKNEEYITGFGFGFLSDGYIDDSIKLNIEEKAGEKSYNAYYHSSISQDPKKINFYNAQGSQVSDLASYMTSSYWSMRRKADNELETEWYPVLAQDMIFKPKTIVNGEVTEYENTLSVNDGPIAMDEHNDLEMYKKWRIYVKTDLDAQAPISKVKSNPDTSKGEYKSLIKYHNTYAPTQSVKDAFDGRAVKLEDYEFIYKFLFTGKNDLSRGSEMAYDQSHGIKGAERFFTETQDASISDDDVDSKWSSFQSGANPKLGIKTGTDKNGGYIEIELVNAVDQFTAMYTLSSNLVGPLPRDFIKSLGTYNEAAKKYGSFNSKGTDGIMDYVLSCGPYQLEHWEKDQLLIFERNDDWFEVDAEHTGAQASGQYKIKGLYNAVVNTANDSEAVYKEFVAGHLDATNIPISKQGIEQGQPGVYETKGDSTFKLNVNSCTQEQWDSINEKVWKNSSTYECKKWMSNSHFLDGLFFSINRKAFAEKRGVKPSLSYFSDAYLYNPRDSKSYNESQFHKDAIDYYHTVDEDTQIDNYGFDYDRAVDNFRIAVNELVDQGAFDLGKSQKEPTVIQIHIRWMNQGDISEYGEDIKAYFERAFNDISVCGGLVKLEVKQDEVSYWEDVYDKWMQVGKFDLGFGAISGNTFDPLNFMEVLKSDNSSKFTLNWGTNTGLIQEQYPIVYKGNKWSYDGLWTVGDHGGIIKSTGEKAEPVNSCTIESHKKLSGNEKETNYYNGYKLQLKIDFNEFSGEGAGSVEYNFKRLDIYVDRKHNITLDATYDPSTGIIEATIPASDVDTENEATGSAINALIRSAQGYDKPGDKKLPDDADYPFNANHLNSFFTYEVYFDMVIAGGSPSEQYVTAKLGE